MSWSFDLSTAPRGRTVQVSRLVADKNSASGQSLRVTDEFKPDDVILETKCGKVIKSYWLPKEQRWAGLASSEQPVAWQPWPTPSGGASTSVSNLDTINQAFMGALDTMGGD